MGSGIVKTYWRPVESGVWHLFTRTLPEHGAPYVTMCGRFRRKRSGGQFKGRPPAALRCGRCDSVEILETGNDQSLPESGDWQGWHHE